MIKRYLKRIGPLYRTINRAKGLRIHEPSGYDSVEVLGSDYGAWAIRPDLLSKESIVYAVGVGEDITFDLALHEKIGCKIHAFDPTPIAQAWISSQDLPPSYFFHSMGLGAADAEVEFQVPPVLGYHSYSKSMEPGADQTGSVLCPIRKLSTLMRALGHDHIDLLKMDIEGFEYDVVSDIINEGITPVQLLVEFHHGLYSHTKEQTRNSVNLLLHAGYRLFWVSNLGREYGFVLQK